MATFRVGVGSFNIKDGAVGIGTEGSGHGKLKVEGTARASTIDVVGGASTFTRYSGFSANQVSVNDRNFLSVYNTLDKNNRTLELTGETQTTGDIIVDDRTTLKVGLGSTACVGSLEYVCVKNHFSVPTGGTNQRNSSVYVEGTIRYNTDLGTMEFFNGNEWRQFTYIADVQNSPSGRGRCLRMGGENGVTPHSNSIGFVNIPTLGNEISFGDLTQQTDGNSAVSSSIRAVNMGGYRMPANSLSDILEYVTIASEGNAIDFGDLQQGARYHSSATNGTRGLIMGGQQPSYTTMINAININTLGNAIDTGGEYTGSASLAMTVYSPIRMIIAGGFTPSASPFVAPSADFINITSSGNTAEFGTLHERSGSSFSNSVRGIFGGGYNNGSIGGMKHITIASLGEFVQFGDMTVNRFAAGNGNAASQTRGLFVGGGHSSVVNIIDYVEITSLGDAQDFGDLTIPLDNNTSVRNPSVASDCHGGLGGY